MRFAILKVRIKALLTIIVITVSITVLSLGTGLLSIQKGIEKVVNDDMTMLSNIASKLASERLELLKSETRFAADRLHDITTQKIVAPEKAAKLLEEEVQHYQYISMALYDHEHNLVAAYGDLLPAAGDANGELAQRAYHGEVAISSTEIAEDGGLIIRVYAPMDGHILISTLPGLIISDLVTEFRILDSGNVFILDKTGIIVANSRPASVRERYNLVEMAQDARLYDDKDGLFRHMTQGGTGIGFYSYIGEKLICSYKPIAGSDGWSVGVAAPVSATSVGQTTRVLLISGSIILLIGSVVAFFAAGIIAKPFESLREMTQIAENASMAKSTFLANTSHEMRTPLNAIIGLSELTLDAGNLPGEVAENLEKVYNSGVTLLGIVNDLLDIAKIESGKFELIPVNYDVPSTINDTRSLNVLRIAEKPITFTLTADETLPSRLIGDELRVKQIFNNLLSNACKYTREGNIDWTIGWERNGNDIWLTSCIRDTGIGIRPEDIGKLFADYHQVDTRSNRAIEGTGLGLAITRRLVEAMDGSISVESIYGKGSTFRVRIRQKHVTDTPIGPTVAEALSGFRYSTNKRMHGKSLVRVQMPYARVLVVDDVQTNLDVSKGIMKPYGMTVDCVTSGFEAIKLVRAADVKYDAIFMDHMMPEMDGMEATRIIREEIGSDYAKTVPIIALTANAIIGNEELFLKHGFQAFLTKPVDVMRMDAILRQWVRHKEFEHDTETQGEAATAEAAVTQAETEHVHVNTPSIEGIDWATGLERFGGDESIYLSVLKSYATNTIHLLDRIREVNEQTLADYAITIHGIKGSSYGIEARVVGKQAEELEHASKAGNLEFVLQNNPSFIEAAEALLARLDALQGGDAATDNGDRPARQTPDDDLLTRMKEAAADFRIDVMEETMTALESFRYETQAELIAWLREQVDKMEFAAIQERLATRTQETHQASTGDKNGRENAITPHSGDSR
ncbi:MAG: response regulator [Azoarcus sp.]|nr:response regulator [Azoarcus sp.]